MAITVPNFSLQFIVLICVSSLASSGFTSDWIQIPSPFQVAVEYNDTHLQTFNVTLTAVTISDSYLWGIDNRASNAFLPGNLVMCAQPYTDGNWIDGAAALDHILMPTAVKCGALILTSIGSFIENQLMPVTQMTLQGLGVLNMIGVIAHVMQLSRIMATCV